MLIILFRQSANIFEQYKLVRITRQNLPWVLKINIQATWGWILIFPV